MTALRHVHLVPLHCALLRNTTCSVSGLNRPNGTFGLRSTGADRARLIQLESRFGSLQ